MNDEQLLIYQIIAGVIGIAILAYIIYKIIKDNIDFNKKKYSIDRHEQLECKVRKENNKRSNIWFITALVLIIFFCLGLGIWGVVPAIIVSLLATLITNIIMLMK